MRKQSLTLIGGMALFLILLGAGCTDAEDNTDKTSDIGSKPAITEQDNTTTNPPVNTLETSNQSGAYNFKVEALGGGKVKMTWDSADNQTKFALIRGKNENPEYKGANTYWYLPGPTYREKIWAGIPAGDHHFRICKLEAEKCVEYGSDVLVNVK